MGEGRISSSLVTSVIELHVDGVVLGPIGAYRPNMETKFYGMCK